MSPHATAKIAVKACLDDLRLRSGFRELMEAIPDWREIENCVVMATEAKITEAMKQEQKASQKQDEIGF